MAKDFGHTKENIDKKVENVKRNCKDCKTEYLATQTIYKNGDIVYSPERCDKCQTSHLTAVRMQKVIDGLKGLANLKPRITSHFGDKGKDAIVGNISQEVQALLDAYAGSTKKIVSRFDLRQIVK